MVRREINQETGESRNIVQISFKLSTKVKILGEEANAITDIYGFEDSTNTVTLNPDYIPSYSDLFDLTVGQHLLLYLNVSNIVYLDSMESYCLHPFNWTNKSGGIALIYDDILYDPYALVSENVQLPLPTAINILNETIEWIETR